MALVSLPVNYFITYPFYSNFMPMDAILGMYKAILPSADTLFKALLIFNVPFNFVFKGIVNSLITFLVYKRLSPIIKGR
jgi:riboflavin transporter FmnP